MAFRTPTLRNSIDRQCGQRVENSLALVWIMILDLRFRRAVRGWAGMVSDGRIGVICVGVVAQAGGGAAGLARRPQLFRCSHIGLRQPDPFFGAGNLALVPLQ